MATFSELFLYIPGAVVFLVGSGQTRSWIRQLRSTGKAEGIVLSCEHVKKKDKKDRDVYNYYNVTVKYTDAESGKSVQQTFKSPTEYAIKQPVKVFQGSDGKTMYLYPGISRQSKDQEKRMVAQMENIIAKSEKRQGEKLEEILGGIDDLNEKTDKKSRWFGR